MAQGGGGGGPTKNAGGLQFGEGTGKDRQTPALVGDGAVMHCAKSVEQQDHEGYACTLALPAELRRAAFSARAFNVETAQVLANAKKPSLALMRFRWWRDAISKVGGAGREPVPAHPVARALDHAFGEAPLAQQARPLLATMVEAREEDARLESQPESLAWLEEYGEKAYGSVLALILARAGLRSHRSDEACSHVGAAQGLLALASSLPQHLDQGRCYIPADVCAEEGLRAEALASSSGRSEAHRGVRRLVERAEEHLVAARRCRPPLEGVARRALLPAVCADRVAREMRRIGFDVVSSGRLGPSARATTFHLFISSLLRRF